MRQRFRHASQLTLLIGTLAAMVALGAPAGAEGDPGSGREAKPTFAGSYLAGRSATTDHDINSAIEFFDQALTLEPRDEALVERTLMLRLAGGEIQEALDLTDEMLDYQSDHWLSHLALAAAEFKRGDHTKALAELKSAGEGPLTDLTAGLMIGWAELGAGNADAALAAIDELEGPEWFAVFKNYHSALIADVAGRPEEAVERMAKAHEIDPTALRVAEAYARLQARAGHNAAALAAFDEYGSDGRTHPMIDGLQAEIASGKKPAPTVANPADGAAEVLYGIGTLISADGGEELAAVYLQMAIYLDANADLALMSLGDLFQQTGRYEEASAAYARIGRDSPMYGRARVQSGISLELLEKTDEAVAVLSKIVAETPSDLDAVVALSNIQRAAEDFQASADTLSKGIATVKTPTRQHWRLYYFRGIAYERTKKWPLAEADFKQALTLFPDQPQVLNYLGYSWVDMGMNLEDALEMIRTAVDLAQDDGYIVDSLGWAYYRLGRFDDAVRELEKAVELKPDDPVINDHLGDAYWKVGRKREAMFQWAHARDFKPEKDVLPTVLAKLEHGLQDEPTATDALPETPKLETPKPETSTAPETPAKVAAIDPSSEIPETVLVAPGDSLWSLADRFYGDPEFFREIFKANRAKIRDPNVIVPGTTLSLPRQTAN